MQFLKCTHGLGLKAARYNDVYPKVDGMTPAQIRAEYPFCKASYCKLPSRLSAANFDSSIAFVFPFTYTFPRADPYTTSRCLDQC